MRIKELLERQKANTKIAAIYGQDSLSYMEMHNKAQTAMVKLLLKSSDSHSIGIFIHNTINYIVAYFSISYADKVIVPINPRIKANELISTIEYCELRVIISDSVNIGLLRKCLNNYSYKIEILNIDKMSYECTGGNIAIPISGNDELSDVALMLHTSGSLSAPKRVMLTHKNLISCTESIIESLSLTRDDRTLIALPLFLASANTSQMLTHIYLGASIVMMDALFTAGYFFKLVEKHSVTNFTGVPFMMLQLIDNRNSKGYDISSMRFICFGGAPTPVEKIKLLTASFPDIDFIHMYGQTEASTRISHLLSDDSAGKPGSVGKPIPNVEWKVVDEEGKDVKKGEIGEVIIKGTNVMKGYYKRKEQTRETIKNGWLYTGDIGRLDEEDFMYIVGRKKSVIIKGGMNIYPEEIEEVLMQHPAVKEACVSGEKHELLGEVPIARLVLKDSLTYINVDEIISFCYKNLSSFKQPESIKLVGKLHKTDSGKIMRIQGGLSDECEHKCR